MAECSQYPALRWGMAELPTRPAATPAAQFNRHRCVARPPVHATDAPWRGTGVLTLPPQDGGMKQLLPSRWFDSSRSHQCTDDCLVYGAVVVTSSRHNTGSDMPRTMPAAGDLTIPFHQGAALGMRAGVHKSGSAHTAKGRYAVIAQMEERRICNPQAVGSRPTRSSRWCVTHK